MNIFSRMGAAWRGFWGVDSSNSEGWVPTGGDPWRVDIARQTEEKYMAISAYFACIRNISEDIGKLPFILYERLEQGKKRATEHALYPLVRYRPAGPITSAALRETLVRFAISWGNGYARIYRLKNGNAAIIQPVHPAIVKPQDNGQSDLEYVIDKGDGSKAATVPSTNMIHIHGVGSNGVTGMSVAGHALQSLTLAAAVRKFGTNIYTTNGRPGGYLKTAAKLGPEARDANIKAWKKAHGGDKMGGTAMLDNGLEYHQVTVNPTDTQYLETCQFTVEDVARWFRMPLHKIQYLVRAQGWSTLDAQNTDYLNDTLMPWLTRIEQEFTYKLLGGHDKYFCEHLVDALLRGDIKTRGDFYVKQFTIGALSINEIRAKENMNPIDEPGGDKHFVPLNMTPAEFANSVSGRPPEKEA